MSDQIDQPRWLVKLEGSARDIEAVKRNFSAKDLAIEDIGDDRLLSSPRFAGCNSAREVEAEASELLANVNVAISIALGRYSGIGIGHIAERTAKGSRTVSVKVAATLGMTATAHVTGADGRIVPAGPSPRSYAERMTELIERDDRVREAARELAAKPVSWGNLYITYETVKRFVAQEGKGLRDTGWISKTEAMQFGATADYYRHGHPRRPIPPGSEISLDDGTKLVKRLFQRMVDRLQPN